MCLSVSISCYPATWSSFKLLMFYFILFFHSMYVLFCLFCWFKYYHFVAIVVMLCVYVCFVFFVHQNAALLNYKCFSNTLIMELHTKYTALCTKKQKHPNIANPSPNERINPADHQPRRHPGTTKKAVRSAQSARYRWVESCRAEVVVAVF